MIIANQWVTGTAIHEQHDRIGPGEGFGILRPASVVRLAADARHLVKTFLQQEHAGIELVFAASVAGRAGHEHDFLLGGFGPLNRQRGRGNGDDQRGKHRKRMPSRRNPNRREQSQQVAGHWEFPHAAFLSCGEAPTLGVGHTSPQSIARRPLILHWAAP